MHPDYEYSYSPCDCETLPPVSEFFRAPCRVVPDMPEVCVLRAPRKRIGRGKEGTVHLLLLPRGAPPMALKLFDRGNSTNQRCRSVDNHLDFLRMYRYTGMVPRLYGTGHASYHVRFIAMEYIDLSLYEPLPKANQEIRNYGAQMLRASPEVGSWSDMYKKGNFLYNRQNENRRVVFLEGGTRDHPWVFDTTHPRAETGASYTLRPCQSRWPKHLRTA